MLHHSSPDNQPKFDMIESAGTGYHYLYHQREYLIKLIALPFIVKLLTVIVLSIFKQDLSQLSTNMILLPSITIEGWLAAQIVRSFAFREQWPVKLTGEVQEDLARLSNRQKCILAGIITYLIIHIGFYVLQAGFTITPEELENLARISAGESLPAETSVSYLPLIIAGIAFLTFIFWFPLIWLYIPATANIYFKDFYATVAKNALVFKMLGCYLICLIPFVAGLSIAQNIFVTALSMNIVEPSTAEIIFMESVSQFVSLLVVIVSTVAMTHGISQFFINDQKQKTEQ